MVEEWNIEILEILEKWKNGRIRNNEIPDLKSGLLRLQNAFLWKKAAVHS
ncbi:hypothetical protein ES705_04689 [subsurface metagenome]